MGLIRARAKLINADGRVYVGESNVLDVNTGVSTLELREGTFTSSSGGTLKLANGHSVVFTPGTLTTHNVTAAQAGVASLVGTTPTYSARGTALVKVLKYPNNATAISHESSPNLIEVPEILPPSVTNLSLTFLNCTKFNHPNISRWDVSSVTNMQSMFQGCSSFNQPLNTWNVSKVTNMTYMFYGCTNFNQPLNTWNVGNVVTMQSMIRSCTNFNQPLNTWNVSKVTNMYSMFSGCSSFNQPLDNWNVSSVTNMYSMFSGCSSFNQPLDNWNVSSVTTMYSMFQGCSSFNQPLNTWNVSSVNNMGYMFYFSTNFSQDLSKWCVSLITSKPNGFNDYAPLLTAAKLPVWGTCPNPV